MNPLSKRELFELKFYRAIGIRLFRDGAFALERWVHRKDGGKNRNYHVRDWTYYGIREHYSFLSFNATIHIAAIALLSLLILGGCAIGGFPAAWYVVNHILILLNVYCILLQRYNALRLRRIHIRLEESYRSRIELQASRLLERIPEGYEERWMVHDSDWLGALREHIRRKQDFLICRDGAAILTRLYSWSQDAGIDWDAPLADSPDPLLPREEGPLYTPLEAQLRWLQGSFFPEQVRVLQPCVLLTADGNCEEAYSRLFGRYSPARTLELADTFLYLFNRLRRTDGARTEREL